MRRVTSGLRLCFVIAALLVSAVAQAGELPSAADILKLHRENLSRLTHLHLRLVHEVEATDVESRRSHAQANAIERAYSPLTEKRKKEVEQLRSRRPFRMFTPMEFYLNGDDYQYRTPKDTARSEEVAKSWSFPESPITADALLTTYRDMTIFSRSAQSTPPSRWWHFSVGRYAYVMQKHLTDVMSIDLPPYLGAIPREEYDRLPYNEFFTQPADKYRVIRQEELNDRLLTVVDVDIPSARDPESTHTFRAWLDLSRGAVPIQMYVDRHSQGPIAGRFDRYRPYNVLVTNEVTNLPNGAFYPSRVLLEEWQDDPDAPRLTKEQRDEVKAGTRTIPAAVFRRYRWDCALVEIKTDFADDFFNLPFPDGQKLYDHDTRKAVGALECQPLVSVGKEAPSLTIAHWLDGKTRTLEDLKGQVVVLEFWGLWCGACRASVPELKAVQEHFQNQPVHFISIHTADGDPAVLDAKIKEFKSSNQWNDISAIDSGTMQEDSVTTTAYGIGSFPMTVIIGADGKVAYVSSNPIGPDCDEEDAEVLAQWDKVVNDFWKNRFDTVNETWPPQESMSEEDQRALFQRVERLYKIHQVNLALQQAKEAAGSDAAK